MFPTFPYLGNAPFLEATEALKVRQVPVTSIVVA